MAASPSITPRVIVARTLTALLGGYAFVWGFIAFGMAGLFALGMPFHDTEHLCSILGLLLYATVFMWVFAARNLVPVAAILFGGGAVMAALGSLIQHQLV